MARPQLGYWNTRAIGEPIWLVLAYVEVAYEDIRYEVSSTELRHEWLTRDEAGAGHAQPALLD